MKHQIDLHIHSKYSDDGEYEPEELVEMCHQKGIKVMAIADHNQVKAIKAARKKAEEYGIRYIFSNRDRLHIQRYQSTCVRIQYSRRRTIFPDAK